jgi:hypothetical protein
MWIKLQIIINVLTQQKNYFFPPSDIVITFPFDCILITFGLLS